MLNKKTCLIITTLFLLVFTNSLFSQNMRGRQGGDPKERLESTMKDLTQKLSLTEEQAENIRDIFVEHFKNSRPPMNGRGRGKADSPPPMMKNQEELDKKIIEMLTDEQVVKFKEWRDEMNKRRNKDLPSGLRK
ncbi:MAG: hypothetical protein SCALA702_30980 [Melioribacteraceae bacterium]|nr:MAG: hypothetical protein SCALA702_30980 [Melioribacteraceae bacterium]